MLELVLQTGGDASEGVLVQDGRVLDYLTSDGGLEGCIYLGRVCAIAPELGAAFVDVGEGEPAFLAARDARFAGGGSRNRPIERRLHEGQAVIVQIKRDAAGGKGPRATTDITLEELSLTLQPSRGGEVSAQAFTNEAAGPDLPPERVEAEAVRLRALWQATLSRAARLEAPVRLHAPDPLGTLMRRAVRVGARRIVAADHASLLRARRWLDERGLADLVGLTHEPDAWRSAGIDGQLEEALATTVPLARGGSIEVHPTPALTVIDVNGGARPPLETDLDAALEIAHQVRLRRLGGIVIIDFIDLRRQAERERLVRALRTAVAGDVVPVEVLPMTRLGLVQMVRKRAGPSLDEMLREPCRLCGGAGRVMRLEREPRPS